MTIHYKSLGGSFGVELLEVDLSKDAAPETLREIVSIFYRNQFIVNVGRVPDPRYAADPQNHEDLRDTA